MATKTVDEGKQAKETLREARAIAKRIDTKHRKEAGLAADLKELREAIRKDTVELNEVLLDSGSGQLRLPMPEKAPVGAED